LAVAREVLAARERVLGARHPDTLDSRLIVSDLLADNGDTAGASAALQALIDSADLPQRPRLLAAEKLANLREDLGDAAGAESLRAQWIAPFLALDPATLDGAGRALRAELTRPRKRED
jgi:hypothetical protein